MHRQFEMASLWVEQEQKRGAIHFHVMLFPFGVGASKDTNGIKGAGFNAWKTAVGGTLSRHANKFTVRPRDASLLAYVVSEVLPIEEFTGKSVVTRWWGYRQNRLARKHWRKPSKREVATFFRDAFDSRIAAAKVQERPVVETPKFYWWTELRREKADVEAWEEARQKIDWDGHKQRVTGSAKPVSDAEFIEFRNRDWRAHKARSADKNSNNDPFASPS